MVSETIQPDSLATVGKRNEAPSGAGRRSFVGAYALAAAYVVFCAGIVVLWHPPNSQPWSRAIAVVVLLGVVLGQSICASIWMSFGTGSPHARTYLGLVWMLLMVAALAGRIAQLGPTTTVTIAMSAVIIAAVLMVQAILTRFLLWTVRVCFGVELTSQTETPHHTGERRQFGIVQLIAFTTMLAIVLAVVRGLVQWSAAAGLFTESPLPLYLFIATATVLVTLPVAAASLLDRHPIIAMVIAALLVAGVTAMEGPILTVAKLAYGDDLNIWTLAPINVSTSLVVLGYTLGLRFFGFRLTLGRRV